MHITSAAEAELLETKWCRVWGRRPDPRSPLTFSTITSGKAGGVAFFLHPSLASDRFQRYCSDDRSGRYLVIESAQLRFVNVYAPTTSTKRHVFFAELRQAIPASTARTIMLGDFNCVLNGAEDRIRAGVWASERCECSALLLLIREHGLVDALDQHRDRTTPLKYLTYWQGATGVRLDRGYVSQRDKDWVVGVSNLAPVSPTDHSGVVLWLRDPTLRPIQRALPPIPYPILGRDQDAIERSIGKAVAQILNDEQRLGLGFDATVRLLTAALRKIKHDERRRAKRQRRKREARVRRRIRSLADLIAYVQARVERRRQHRHQAALLHRCGDSAHLFRRFVQLDQRRLIPPLQRADGTCSDGGTSIADTMAEEWQALFGARHATAPRDQLRSLCADLFTILESRQLSSRQQEALVAAVTESEVRQALSTLGAHKAAGPDRLGNDFFKDWATLLAPWLATEYTKILNGSTVPDSFRDALIVPIPKSGDPRLAANYRPISLLQSSYKVFTKILAGRVQHSLGHVINEDQNGFVRGRVMADNINLMRAVLQQAPKTNGAGGAVLLVDFRKAYDTIDREFLWLALEGFGYPQDFIHLITRLHLDTRARFLVNGELSKDFLVASGIRQGCPLAPLLFLLAAETLKYALSGCEQIAGVTLEGQERSHLHTLSAFVDDSAIFIRDIDMVQAVEGVLGRFGAVFGLQAQPHKSHAIVFDASFTASQLGSFPVVPHDATVTYLGIEIGLTDLATVNWDKRCDKLAKRLGTLSQYALGVTDRVKIINLSGVSSILFTAQFFPPSTAVQRVIDATWRQFVWDGTVRSSSPGA